MDAAALEAHIRSRSTHVYSLRAVPNLTGPKRDVY